MGQQKLGLVCSSMSSFKTKLGVGRHFYALRCCCSTCDPYGLFYLSKHHRLEVHFRFACAIYYQLGSGGGA